ncbi:MAG: phytoene/squalene synthase family protein [Solirubrobacteraceae bacterium]
MSAGGSHKHAGQLAAAYQHCASLTRAQAANFYYGIALLPREKRHAMCAVYAFARRIDDIGDGELAVAQKRLRLDEQARALSEMLTSQRTATDDPVMLALTDSARRFPLPADALEELIEGVRMDLDEVQYERFEDLLVYCRRVAGGIGRLCVAIFGARELQRAFTLADELGVALQLTNILRDIREDALNGRVYLPADELERFGLLPVGARTDIATLLREHLQQPGRCPPELEALVHFQARRARVWFGRGGALVGLLDRRSAGCVTAMSGIYRRLLERIDEQPSHALAMRTSLPKREKVLVAMRAILGQGA